MGKTNPSLRSSVSSETEEGAVGVAPPGIGGRVAETSTTVSVDATGTTDGVSNPSPVLG